MVQANVQPTPNLGFLVQANVQQMSALDKQIPKLSNISIEF